MRDAMVRAVWMSLDKDLSARAEWVRLNAGQTDRLERPPEAPAVLVVRAVDRPMLVANLAPLLVDCGSKDPRVSLSRLLLGREGIPLVTGTHRTLSRLRGSVRRLLRNARTVGERKGYVVAVADAVFEDLNHRLHRAPAVKRATPRAAWSSERPSEPLAELIDEVRVPDWLETLYIGRAPEVALVRKCIVRSLESTDPVLIVGEPGTGKNTVAAAIHNLRNHGRLRAVSCPDSNEDEVADALFPGRSARSGAGARRTKAADPGSGRPWPGYGTLFLDEISALSGRLQRRLYAGIRERDARLAEMPETESEKAGWSGVVAATNHDLFAMVNAGQFDDRLYYRLRRFMIYTPALRDHLEDIPAIATALWRSIVGDERAVLARPVLAVLETQRWPGNVRELKSLLIQARRLFGPAPLTADHVEALLRHDGRSLRFTPTDRRAALQVETLQHMRRCQDVIRACEVAFEASDRRPRRGAPAHRPRPDPLPRLVAELAALCDKPSLFPSPSSFAATLRLLTDLRHYTGLAANNGEPGVTRSFLRNGLSRSFASFYVVPWVPS